MGKMSDLDVKLQENTEFTAEEKAFLRKQCPVDRAIDIADEVMKWVCITLGGVLILRLLAQLIYKI